MSETDKDYELKMLKMVVNKYLDESISVTEKSLNALEVNRDQVVWDLATRIYSQSGHKVEFSIVRDVVNSRIRAIKHQLDVQKEKERIAEQARRARRVAEQKAQQAAEEARRVAEARMTNAIGKFGGNECKAKVFVRVLKIISEQLEVDESEVNLDAHLSNHLRADELDLVELVMALEEEFEIEISNVESENKLGMNYSFGSGSWWSSGSSSSYSSFKNAGEECIVRNFVELIYEKVSD